MDGDLKIGAVAQLASVSVDSVRYYERRGLIPPPKRRASGYRVFGESTVERIRFIKQLQGIGFSLDDVAGVLAMVDEGTANCSNQQVRFEEVLARIDSEIKRLRTTRQKIARVLKQCQDGACSWSGADQRCV